MRKVPFDYLVIATGMRPSYFGHDEFAKYAPGLKSLADAESIRAKILSAYERADATNDECQRAREMTFVLVGGGPDRRGAGRLDGAVGHNDAACHSSGKSIRPSSSIILVEGSKRILPTFAESLAKRATRRLEKLGVEILTGVKVEAVDEKGVVASGRRIASATVLWTAGVAASPIVKLLGRETDRAGRVSVGPHLDVPGVPDVFVVGDASSVVSDGRPVPGVAQAAIQQGRHVGRLIARQLKGRQPGRPFRYHDKGSMAVVGRNFAILESGHLRTSGFLTWLVWVVLHVMSLPQAQNRLRVQTQWFWSYFTGQRGARLIPERAAAPSEQHAAAAKAYVAS